MKFVFVINPMAGKGKCKGTEKLKNDISETAEKLNKEFDIYTTKSVGDAEMYVRNRCKKDCRTTAYIACGVETELLTK